MCARAPSARRARSTSRGLISTPRSERGCGAGGQLRGQAPAALCGAGREQPGSQQSLAAAEIEHAVAPGEQPLGEQGGERRIAPELAAREVPGEAPGGPVRRARRLDERGDRRVGTHACAARSVTGLRPASCTASRRRGSTSRASGAPGGGARRVPVVQQQDVAGGKVAA